MRKVILFVLSLLVIAALIRPAPIECCYCGEALDYKPYIVSVFHYKTCHKSCFWKNNPPPSIELLLKGNYGKKQK